MNKCKCYRVIERLRRVDFLGQSFYENVGVCRGTKEMEECSCGGDEHECNFYPEIRERANKKIYIDEAIAHFRYGITHDIFSEPVTTYARLAIEALEKMKE